MATTLLIYAVNYVVWANSTTTLLIYAVNYVVWANSTTLSVAGSQAVN